MRDARKVARRLRAAARGRGAQAKLAAAERLERACVLAEKVCAQIRQRLAGEPIKDRLVSLADPDARPIRKGKAGKPTEFGSVHQIAEITPHTRTGARGFVLAPVTAPGNPREEKLLLKGAAGTNTWVGWGALAYNLDTYARYAVRDA